MSNAEAVLMDIGDVIEASGVPASTLHVWERAGLLHPQKRLGLRRQYSADVLDRIALIVIAKRAGFTLQELAELFSPQTFTAGKDLLQAKLVELRQRRTELDAAIIGLEHAIACPARSPLECDRFRSTLPDVLPIQTKNGSEPFDRNSRPNGSEKDSASG